MKHIFGIVLITTLLVAVLGIGSNVDAQDGPPNPTPGIDPILLEGMEITELRLAVIRQLAGESFTNRQFVTREELRNTVIGDMRDMYTPSDAAYDLLFYDAFGFVPRNFTLHEYAQNLMQSSIASYYDYQQDTLVFIFEGNNIMEPLTSVRYGYIYLQRLLNDHYDVYDVRDDAIAQGNIDQALAINALIEGDTQHALQFYVRDLISTGELDINSVITTIGVPGKAVPTDTPDILRAELSFAAQFGLPFVQELYQNGESWRLVDLVYERLPLSTEQVLHPHLYLLYEEPHTVRLEPLDTLFDELPGNHSWTLQRDQTLGEFYLREHLSQVYAPDLVDEIATGWGGDRFLLYSNENREIAMVWRTSWDSTIDFEQFEQRYQEFLSGWLNVQSQQYPDDTRCWMGGERSVCTVILPGEDVLIVQAPTLDLTINMLLFEREHLATTRIIG